jgi:hypothetical protein
MTSIRKPGSPTFSCASPSIPSKGSTNCCRGIGAPPSVMLIKPPEPKMTRARSSPDAYVPPHCMSLLALGIPGADTAAFTWRSDGGGLKEPLLFVEHKDLRVPRRPHPFSFSDECGLLSRPLEECTPTAGLIGRVELLDGFFTDLGQRFQTHSSSPCSVLQFARDKRSRLRCVIFQLLATLLKRSRHYGNCVWVEFKHAI